jgi:hypothetical protein
MRKLCALVLALGVGLSSIGCSCSIEKKAVADLQATHDLIFPEYIKLVEKEFATAPDKIDNRKKLVQSSNNILNGLKKVTE